MLGGTLELTNLLALVELPVGQSHLRPIVITLAVTILIGSLNEPLAGALSAVRGAALPSTIAACAKAAELLTIGAALHIRAGPMIVAEIMLAGAAVNVTLHLVGVTIYVPWFSFWSAKLDLGSIIKIWPSAASFFVVFVCLNIVSVYLPRILISHMLGPIALATFSVLVTYTKTARNFATMTSQATQVEIGRLWAHGDVKGARHLTHRMLRNAMLIAIALLVSSLLLAPLIIPRWTHGTILLNWPLIVSLALVALIGTYFDGLLLAAGAVNRVRLAAIGYSLGLSIGLGFAALLLPFANQLTTIGICLLLPEIGGILFGRQTIRLLNGTSSSS